MTFVADRVPSTVALKLLLAVVLLTGTSFLSAADDQALDVPQMQRDADGTVTITASAKDAVIRYTIDGSDPVARSGPYLAPIALPQGGIVKARTFSNDRKKQSSVIETRFDALPGAKPLPSSLVTCTQDRDWPIYDWAKRHAEVSKLVKERQSSLLFIGDSITQMFGGEPHDRGQPGTEIWDKYYGTRNAANLGFGYDYLENTLWRLQHGELEGAKARAVVVHIGTNNLGKNSPTEIVAGIKAICDEVHRQQPQAQILLMAILPRGAKPDATRTKLNEVNAMLVELNGKGGVTVLDIGEKFLQPDGSLPKELMGDYLHPSAKGYQIWADAMEPILAKMLASN
jgi:lysophospholipase L1-like esterase